MVSFNWAEPDRLLLVASLPLVYDLDIDASSALTRLNVGPKEALAASAPACATRIPARAARSAGWRSSAEAIALSIEVGSDLPKLKSDVRFFGLWPT